MIDKKIYIGKTNDFERRKHEHVTSKTSHLFSRALAKYGQSNFKWEIIESNIATLKLSNEREKYWINYFNAYFRNNNSNGYNMTKGGDGGSCWNIRKVAAYDKQGNLIKAFSSVNESVDYFKISGTSSVCFVCGKMALCKNMMFRYYLDVPLQSIAPFEKRNARQIAICKLDNCGNLVRNYSSISEAAKDGYNRTGIIGVLKGRYQQSCGFRWCYKKDLNIAKKPLEEIKGTEVSQYTKDGEFIAKYSNCAEAARKNNLSNYKSIHKAIKSKSHIALGYKWQCNT